MIYPRDFAKNVYWTVIAGGKTALTDATYYPASGSFIDTNGYDHVCIQIYMDLVGTPDFSVYQATAADGTPKALTGAAKTDVVTADDGKWFTIEFPVAALDTANGYRYITVLVAAGSSTDYANISVLLYRARNTPVTQPAGYYDAVLLGG